MTLSNIVAYVTGGGRGLGRATCKMFVNHGAKVIVADLSQQHVDEVVSELGSSNAMGAVMDVTSETQVLLSMDEAVSKFGKITVNVNCAGIAPGAWLLVVALLYSSNSKAIDVLPLTTETYSVRLRLFDQCKREV